MTKIPTGAIHHHSHGCGNCGRMWTCSEWQCILGLTARGSAGEMIVEVYCVNCQEQWSRAQAKDNRSEQAGK